MTALLVLLAIVIVIAIYVIAVYNNLQSLKTKIEAAIQEIGNQLKRQANLIPNLQETVKGYVSHEEKIFDQLTQARKITAQLDAKDLESVGKAEEAIKGLTQGLNVVFESNPQLQANTNFQTLMNELSDTADKVMYSRRALINLTQNFNQKLVTFPSNVIAKLFNFQKMAGLKTENMDAALNVSQEEAQDVQVKF